MHPWFSRTYSELRAEYVKRPLHQAYIRQNRHLQTELQNELRPEARKVFQSREYSRARYVNDITFRPVSLLQPLRHRRRYYNDKGWSVPAYPVEQRQL
jgi:hypothetical protein